MKWDITVGSRFSNLEGRRKLVRIIGELEKSEEKIVFDLVRFMPHPPKQIASTRRVSNTADLKDY